MLKILFPKSSEDQNKKSSLKLSLISLFLSQKAFAPGPFEHSCVKALNSQEANYQCQKIFFDLSPLSLKDKSP